jgi:hypothetical protein
VSFEDTANSSILALNEQTKNIMTWTDLWTEFLLKLGIPLNRKPRKPPVRHHTVAEFMTNAQIIKGRSERVFEDKLNRRTKTVSYLRTDDRLFESYVDLIAHTTIGRENFSFAREVGNSLLRLTKKFETDNSVFVNKSHLYFGLSLNSVYLNDSINTMIYWELSQEQESQTLGATFNATIAINNAIDKFSSVINPINLSLNENPLYRGLKDNYTFISDFTDNLRAQHTPELFAYFSSAVRFRQVDYWLKNDFTAMTKIYSQELVNSLCILCEANIKNFTGVTKTMLGPIIHDDLPTLNANVATFVGRSGSPATGLFLTYPTGSETQFNTNFPLLVNAIKANTLSDDDLKAHLIYGVFMLRNKSLHDFNPHLAYYNNKPLFIDTVGLLFAAVSAIRNL